MRKNNQGFTLIELLIVVMIISLVSAAVVFKTPSRPTLKEMENFTDVFAAQMRVASQEAFLKMALLRVNVASDHYEFYQYQTKNNRWQALQVLDPFWKRYSLPHGMFFKMNTTNPFSIKIQPDGSISAFTLILANKYNNNKFILVSDGSGSVRIEGRSS